MTRFVVVLKSGCRVGARDSRRDLPFACVVQLRSGSLRVQGWGSTREAVASRERALRAQQASEVRAALVVRTQKDSA